MNCTGGYNVLLHHWAKNNFLKDFSFCLHCVVGKASFEVKFPCKPGVITWGQCIQISSRRGCRSDGCSFCIECSTAFNVRLLRIEPPLSGKLDC